MYEDQTGISPIDPGGRSQYHQDLGSSQPGSVGDCFDHHGVLGGVEGLVVEAARDVLVELAAVHQAERAKVLNTIAGLEHDGLNQ